ncbi:ABC transporter substrate-binding protein [Natronorubrum daqingense]|nr:ABC transporter substrate-binding protein [Natronorubrum daqingense]
MQTLEDNGPNTLDQLSVRRRHVLRSTAGGIAGLSLAGCLDSTGVGSESSDDEEPVTIGLLAPHPESDYIGRSMAQAAELAVDELNENGGIDDTPVELVVANTNATPLEARRQYQHLVLREGADVTMGVFDSPALRTIMNDIAEHETIHLTTGAASATVSELIADDYDRYKYHFRVGPTNDHHLGTSQMSFLDEMADDLDWNSVALLAENYDWTQAPWDVYQSELEDTGVELVVDERYPPATDDFTSRYEEAEEAGADMVLISAAHTGNEAIEDWATQQRQFAFGGTHVPMQLPEYFEQTNGACEYAVGQTSATADSEFAGGDTAAFVDAYRDEFDGAEPVYTGYHTYDAVNLFAAVVESAGTLETDALVSELETEVYDGVAGTVEFYGDGDEYPHDLVSTDEDTLFYQWQTTDSGDGVQEIIWPEEQATDLAAGEYVDPEWV